MAAGHPFFAGWPRREIVPLPTGHWPMLSEPKRWPRHSPRSVAQPLSSAASSAAISSGVRPSVTTVCVATCA